MSNGNQTIHIDGTLTLDLDKRELFAAMAMQGIITRDSTDWAGSARRAVLHADALLAALAKTKEEGA